MAHHIFRGIAQLVEQRSPKPRAEGSSPSAPAKISMFVIGQKGLKAPFFGAFLLFIGTFLVKFSYKENKTKIE